MIGARAAAICGKQRVHRADAEIGGAFGAGRGACEAERREIADALIALPSPQRIKLRADAEAAPRRSLRAIGLRRRDGQRAGDAVDFQPMPADRQRRQIEIALVDLATVRERAPPAVADLGAPADRFAPSSVVRRNSSGRDGADGIGAKRDLHGASSAIVSE